jgi:hypothetical protein
MAYRNLAAEVLNRLVQSHAQALAAAGARQQVAR